MEQRTELCLHTTTSENFSTILPREALEGAVRKGLKAVAITDLCSVQSFYDVAFFQNRMDADLKVIYGAEMDNAKVPLVLAKNKAGLNALFRLLSEDTEDGVEKVLREHRAELLIGYKCCCFDDFYSAMQNEDATAMEEFATDYDFLILTAEGDHAKNKAYYELGKKLGIPVVAVGECTCIDPEDHICTEIVNGVLEGDVRRPFTKHLRTTEEMLELFAYLGEAAAYEVVVTNPNNIVDRIDFVDLLDRDIPLFALPEAEETICRLCNEKLELLYGKNPPMEIRRRLDRELSLLGDNASLCLLLYRMVKNLHDTGVPSSTGGTIGSSFVAYLLGISDCNPLKAHYRCDCAYAEFVSALSGLDLPKKACPRCGRPMLGDGNDIPFEICLGLEGEWSLLANIIVPEAARKQGLKAIVNDLGQDRVAMAGEVSTFKRKTAENFVQMFEHREKIEFAPEEKQRIIKKIMNMKCGDKRHPGGVMLLPQGMRWEEITPLQNRVIPEIAMVAPVTQMDCKDLEGYLPKVNLLGDDRLEQLQNLYAITGTKPEEVDYTDPAVYELIRDWDCCGIPELSAAFYEEVPQKVGVDRFSRLVKVVSMAHGTSVWKENGENLVNEQPFDGLISNRDEVFLSLLQFGLSRETAFKAMVATRRGRLAWHDELCQTLVRSGVPDWYIESMKKVHYLCPKAHAVQIARVAYCFAWFKLYYPEAFYKVMLSCPEMKEYLARTTEELVSQYNALIELGENGVVANQCLERIELLVEARERWFEI